MTHCKYWDCGWCYAPDDVETNATLGGCFEPNHCPHLKSQMTDALFCNATLGDWLGPEPPEEPEMTEIEKPKQEIEALQTKLKILERQESTSTPCEKAYRDAYGTYPVTGMDASTWHVTTWLAFQKGYDAGVAHKALKRGQKIHKEMEEAVNKLEEEGTWNYNPDKKFDTTEDLIDGLMKDPPDFLRFSLGPTLYEVIEDWYFYTTDASVLDLVQKIEKWLPPEQSSTGTQSTETEIAVEAHNELLTKIKSKLWVKE